MSRETTIYGLVDCFGTVRYVGKTVNPRSRGNDHRRVRTWCAGYLVLEVVPAGEDWRAAERRQIEEWNRWGDLENVRNGGNGSETHSPEARAKISAARTGMKFTAQHCANMSAALKGKPVRPRTAEHEEKLAATRRGRPMPAETKAKISASLKGRVLVPRSAEVRAKISATQKGRMLVPEHRARVLAAAAAGAAARKGKPGSPHTPEARAKISAARRRATTGNPRSV